MQFKKNLHLLIILDERNMVKTNINGAMIQQKNCDRDFNIKIYPQPGLEAQKVEKRWSSLPDSR